MRERTSSGDRWHVGEVPAAGGARTVIVAPQAARIIAAAWVPGRREFLMSAVDPDNGLPQIWRVSYPGGTRSRLTDDLHNYKDLTVTADGSTVVAQSLGHLVQLWIAPGAKPGKSTHIASGTIRGGYDGLAWTADDRLLHGWGERGYYDLWSMAPDGGARRRITDGGREVSDTSVSPDGQDVFFVSTRSGSPQIWRMTPDGQTLRQLTHLPSRVANPIVSADGRWVYFTADPRGFPTLWKMTGDGSSPEEVLDKAIELFDLSPDGKWIAFSYRDDAAGRLRVEVDSINGTTPSRRFEIEPIYAMRWTPDGKGLAYTHPDGSLRVQPIDGGAPYELAPPRAGFMVVSFAWSRGGRYLAYTAAANPVDAIGFRLR
jgi:Tol biopolymer transport system component